MKLALTLVVAMNCAICPGKSIEGVVLDADSGERLPGVEVWISGEKGRVATQTGETGEFKIPVADDLPKAIRFQKQDYMFDERVKTGSSGAFDVQLRKKKMSAASIRWEKYMKSDEAYNAPEIPENSDWKLAFEETTLAGDFAPDPDVIRRDPSSVIRVGDLYYVWYTKGSGPSTWFKPGKSHEKVFPWDLCDVWYATSEDGWKWDERGPAVQRGPEGAFDDRSVFTPEVFAHQRKFYLVYQVVKAPYVVRVKNNVAMAVADSPDGP